MTAAVVNSGGEHNKGMIMVESIRPAAIYGLGKLICTSPTSIVSSILVHKWGLVVCC